jgi:toxin ParE1/3/4
VATRRRRVVWTENAQVALDEVLAFIAEESLQGGQHILRAALDLAASLETLSERGRVVPEIGNPRVREVFVHRYRLLYEVAADEVRILAFLRGSNLGVSPWCPRFRALEEEQVERP